ncbi:RNA-binding S4 domain-containing protein [Sphingomonas sp. SUN039]|uniref:RNA-binding S4 domain-containing protein n=1 Tax=Sphingomonas sp. SUN039 TaxID=2937787 RepID=UPI00216466F9|nr:S4 domain-containing protein [Sphingomonas sp. SUN039]UVO55959.1 S4 domain-containing protein [Sphingomonas sp. SUN039]
MRLDRFLWFARISASRSFAQALAASGHLRIDGRPVAKAAAPVHIGNVLSFATHRGDIRVLRIESLPTRRGPPAEARACYTDMIDGADAQN